MSAVLVPATCNKVALKSYHEVNIHDFLLKNVENIVEAIFKAEIYHILCLLKYAFIVFFVDKNSMSLKVIIYTVQMFNKHLNNIIPKS